MTDFNLTEFLHVILSLCHILQAKKETKEKLKKLRNEEEEEEEERAQIEPASAS